MAKVYLISSTPNALRVIASQQLNMRGNMVKCVDEVSDLDAEKLTLDVFKTNLSGALEFVDLVWNIENVTRGLTHQLVRYRVGTSFSQESMRFVNKAGFEYLTGKSIKSPEAKIKYDNMMNQINSCYQELIDMGVETQDARGILPTNIFTKIGFKCTYRTLYNIAQTRLCLQAQEQEWRDVIGQMKTLVAEKVSSVLADNLQPICYHTGNCEYGSIFDRVCPLQEKYPVKNRK